MTPDTLSEFKRGWRVLLATSAGNGSGLSGIPFYTFGVFVLSAGRGARCPRRRVS